jgi:hypothetical protein
MRAGNILIGRVPCAACGLHLLADRLRRIRDLASLYPASLCLAFVLLAPQALAQPWQRLPDGRVVIEVKDHKLAFDPNIWRAGTGYPAAVEFHAAGEKERYSLSRAIEDPNGARVFFSRFDALMVTMTNGWNEPGLFLNRFDRRSLPDSSRIELLIFDKKAVSRQACDQSDYLNGYGLGNVNCTESDLGPFETKEPDSDGFFRIVTPTPYARAQSAKYVLAPEIRKTYAPGPISVGCSQSLNDSEPREWGQCSVATLFSDGVGTFYQFRYSGYPKSTWIELDHRMRRIYADVLLHNEGGQK